MVLEQLSRAPEPLTPRQRWVFLIAVVVVALSRFLAISRSLWDWDEALFSLAMRDYDVFHHHPHPPGFPLFIGMAKLVRFAVESDFRALQTVTVLGALALFPAVFVFAREVRLRFDAAIIAALLVAFFPNVWFFGGTSFSDVPSLTLIVLACALLLRGCRDGRAYDIGAFVLAIAAGFRPQNLLVGLAPALIATAFRWRQTRSVRQPLAAAAIGLATLGLAYGGAALATGDLATYFRAVRTHSEYIRNIDSYRNPERPPMLHLFDDFFFRPYHHARVNIPLGILVLIGLASGLWRRRSPILLTLVTFGPFALAGWLMLDMYGTSRLSIGWSPMVAVLAAAGIVTVSTSFARIARRSGVATAVTMLITLALVTLMASWTLPSLKRVRRDISPPIQAIGWIRTNVPRDAKIFVDVAMIPVADLFLNDYQTEVFHGAEPESAARRAWVLREGTSARQGARTFAWRRTALWDLVRHRFFEVAVVPHQTWVRFDEGWYAEESFSGATWRWMQKRGRVVIGPTAESGVLSLRGSVPLDHLRIAPEITITLNGQQLDRFVVSHPEFARSYRLPTLSSPENELLIETSELLNPRREGVSDDARDLGLRLDAIGWSAETEGE